MLLVKGSKGSDVKTLQAQLLALEYPLPRYGADGILGDETLSAMNDFLSGHVDEANIRLDDTINDAEQALLAQIAGKPTPPKPPQFQDVTKPIRPSKYWYFRGWHETTGITLHQTDCVFANDAKRWQNVPVQIGVSQDGTVYLINHLAWNTPHGHGLNKNTVGIEIEGRFVGREGQKSGGDPSNPNTLSPSQEAGVQEAIRWIQAEVARHGGAIKHIFAHRQSKDSRQRDPGGEIWRKIALWSEAKLGLKTQINFKTGSGAPIPTAWDPNSPHKY